MGVGYSCVDKICTVEDFPIEDGSTHVLSREIQGGGAVATAVVAASKLGVSSVFVGNIGNDSISDEIIRLFKEDGICTDYLIRRNDCYGLESVVMVNPENGSRTKFPQRDFNPLIRWDNDIINLIGSADVLHLDGTNYGNAIAAAEIAKENGVLVSLDGCSMQKENDKNKVLAGMADILIMNSRYPLKISEKTNYNEALLEIASWGQKKVIGCTLGDGGSKFIINGEVVDFPSCPANKVVDTTGCGDVFHGAFLNAYVRGMKLEQCIKFASVAASYKCAFHGGRAGIPNMETVLKIIGE